MNTAEKKMENYEEHLEAEVDQMQSPRIEDYIVTVETSKLGEIIKEIREKEHLSPEELALKCGTTANYITDIENNSLDIPVSTLSAIVRQGLNGHLELRVRL